MAVGAAIVTLAAPADSRHASRINRFVDTLFDRFNLLFQAGCHPKWQEVSLLARVAGVPRYPKAQSLAELTPWAEPANLINTPPPRAVIRRPRSPLAATEAGRPAALAGPGRAA